MTTLSFMGVCRYRTNRTSLQAHSVIDAVASLTDGCMLIVNLSSTVKAICLEVLGKQRKV